jgi:hypothetical protein
MSNKDFYTLEVTEEQAELKSFLYIKAYARTIFPSPVTNVKIIDYSNKKKYESEFDFSFRIKFLHEFFIDHPEIEVGTKVYIRQIETFKSYEISLDEKVFIDANIPSTKEKIEYLAVEKKIRSKNFSFKSNITEQPVIISKIVTV